MIQRFVKVDKDLYRGSCPSPKDIEILKNKYGIKKIVSLDLDCGKKIANICKLLEINQVIIPLDENNKSVVNLLSHNLKDLLIKGGPTFIHCRHGKDRTGFVVALYQVKYKHKSPEDAIKEAKSLDFGIDIEPQFEKCIQLYEKLIRSAKPVKDENNADIVSNEREGKGDSRDSYLDEANRSSFEAYLGKNRQYPFDSVDNPINDQSMTRQNYQDEPIKQHSEEHTSIPQVGQYDNSAGIEGTGPSIMSGGFIYS